MHRAFKALAWIAGSLVLILAATYFYFEDNIRGYYKYKSLCETDGGLQIFHPLEKDVGWTAKLNSGHFLVANMKHVAFGRYVDKDGAQYDIRYRTGPIGADSSYDIVPADRSRRVVYSLSMFTNEVPGTPRTHRTGYEVREIETGRLMLRWTEVGYSMFDQDHTLLGAPSGQVCHSWQGFELPANQSKYFGD